jgi:uncharacterized protein (TIGR03435 family)
MRRFAAGILISLPLGLAQTPAPPAFEAAAIKPSALGDTGVHYTAGEGRVSLKNMSVRAIIQTAYKVKESQITGPTWIDNTRYTVEAKADSRAEDKELMLMMQTLLADRFKLVIHREQKMVPGYGLVVAKGGLKVKPSEGEGSSSHGEGNKLTATHLDMPRFARWVERVLNQPVADETHVSGGFDFVLEYANERRPPRPADSVDALPGSPEAPSIFTALPQQLGLRLEPKKLPVDMLVVDRIEHPSDN